MDRAVADNRPQSARWRNHESDRIDGLDHKRQPWTWPRLCTGAGHRSGGRRYKRSVYAWPPRNIEPARVSSSGVPHFCRRHAPGLRVNSCPQRNSSWDPLTHWITPTANMAISPMSPRLQ
jgi:hypothetical protein